MRPLLLVFLLVLCAFAEGERTLIRNLPARGAQFTTDPMGNLYILKDERIDKYDPKGNFQRTFSNKTYGSISSADATNLLRVVLFYRDFSQVVFLDNTMSPNGSPLRLQELGFPQATLVCNSYDNAFWLYDQQNFELTRLNNSLQISHRTGNLAQQLNLDLQPNFLLEAGNRLYLNNPSTGILVFDVFGTYYKTIPVKNLNGFQVRGDEIIYFSDHALHSYSLLSGDKNDVPLNDSTVFHARIEKERMYLQRDTTLSIYQVTQ